MLPVLRAAAAELWTPVLRGPFTVRAVAGRPRPGGFGVETPAAAYNATSLGPIARSRVCVSLRKYCIQTDVPTTDHRTTKSGSVRARRPQNQ